MAEENNMGAFFANKKKKGKKKGVKSTATKTIVAEAPVEKSSSVAVDSGWADDVEEKKAIINTSGKSVVDLSNDKAPVVKENKETGNKFNMEETKNIFQSARAAGLAKGDAVEVAEPVKKVADMTWKEKMELRKKTGTGGPLKMDDERAFPTLGGKSGASSAGGAWGKVVKDDAEGGGDSDGEDQDADAAAQED